MLKRHIFANRFLEKVSTLWGHTSFLCKLVYASSDTVYLFWVDFEMQINGNFCKKSFKILTQTQVCKSHVAWNVSKKNSEVPNKRVGWK